MPTAGHVIVGVQGCGKLVSGVASASEGRVGPEHGFEPLDGGAGCVAQRHEHGRGRPGDQRQREDVTGLHGAHEAQGLTVAARKERC